MILAMSYTWPVPTLLYTNTPAVEGVATSIEALVRRVDEMSSRPMMRASRLYADGVIAVFAVAAPAKLVIATLSTALRSPATRPLLTRIRYRTRKNMPIRSDACDELR